MKSKEQDRALQAPSEANRDKHMNYLAAEDTDTNSETSNDDEDLETRRKKHDADSGSDGTSDEMLQKENLIDPGNEHHHKIDTGKRDTTGSARHDADAGGDASGTVGREPGESKNDEPDTSGEDE